MKSKLTKKTKKADKDKSFKVVNNARSCHTCAKHRERYDAGVDCPIDDYFWNSLDKKTFYCADYEEELQYLN